MRTEIETAYCDKEFGKLFSVAIEDYPAEKDKVDGGACNICGRDGTMLVVDSSDPTGGTSPCTLCLSCIEMAFTKHGVSKYMHEHKPA